MQPDQTCCPSLLVISAIVVGICVPPTTPDVTIPPPTIDVAMVAVDMVAPTEDDGLGATSVKARRLLAMTGEPNLSAKLG